MPGIAPHYQIVLTREGALDAMTVEVELAPDTARDDAFRAKKSGEIAGDIKSRVGVSCTIALKSPGELPRSQGKAVRVRDLRKK